MKPFKTFLLFSCTLIFSTYSATTQNTITLDTILDSTLNRPFSETKVGDRIAWVQKVNDTLEVHLYSDGVVDVINTPKDFIPNNLALTNTTLAWAAKSLNFAGGHCSSDVPNGYYYSNSVLTIDDSECIIYCSNGTNTLRLYNENGFDQADIVGPGFNIIATIPTSYEGRKLTYGNIASYWEEHIFIKASIDDMAGGFNRSILYYNVKNSTFQKIYETSKNIFFTEYKNSNTLVFRVALDIPFHYDIYLYDGNNTSLIESNVNGVNSLQTFQDRIVWTIPGHQIVQYRNGVFDTLVQNNLSVYSLYASECYLAWITLDNNNNTSELNLYDGFNIQSFNFNGVINSQRKIQIDNDGFVFVLEDLTTMTSRLIKGEFQYSCCTGEDIITNTNEDEFSNSFIESTAAFTCNTTPEYQALEYIELQPDFSVPQGYTFCAEIQENCILYVD